MLLKKSYILYLILGFFLILSFNNILSCLTYWKILVEIFNYISLYVYLTIDSRFQ